ncbi:hypothetical protein BaRGS_00002823 [Batillaria attramentaria]|uniref:RRM domain-containing protein n=1 Tax=Batillaria attramentaria TaxID=370345 RepID=A0ABD0M448_9CAEN
MAENMEQDVHEEDENSDDESMNKNSEDSDSEDNTEQDEARVRELEKEISKNPYLYDSHVALIKKLRDLGDLQRLRAAREAMRALFPLTEELWLEWLRDETPLVSEQEERNKVEKLFELAVKDYLSVPVWLEYVQFVIGGMGSEGGIQHIRDVFENALTAVGLHVTQGANVWEAYREFENALLAGLMPQPGAVTTKEQEEAFNAQHQKIASLFKRQLAVPLMDMEESFAEYKEWLGGSVDPEVEKAYNKALAVMDKIKPFEEQLLASEAPHLEAYQKYIEFEIAEGDPARIQCLFERAIQENCLVPDLWLQYTKYLDEKLKIGSISLATYERAFRNCPWSAQLWRNYILTLERTTQPFDVVKGTMDRALVSGVTEASDFLLLWTVYCDYLRRRINWNGEHENELETFRLTVERAADHLFENFGLDGDPEASLRQYWASIEARYCKNLERARELWNAVMQEGYGNQAAMWLNYYRLERTFGDAKHCRRILQRALNSVTDWLECITQAYIDFEREEGTLEDYEQAYAKCEAQLARVNERKAKAAEKEAVVKEQKKLQRAVTKAQKKQVVKTEGSESQTHKTEVGKWSESVTGARTVDSSRKRKAPETAHKGQAEQGFKVPSLPHRTDEPAAKKVKEEPVEHGESVQHNPSKDNVTVFVSNLDYEVGEERIREAFHKCGDITNVRLVKNFKGKSKGFCYVEFADPNSVLAALKLDRQPLDGRPMFVSRCEDRSAGNKTTPFKYSTDLEKKKLFVSRLPYSCTVDTLTTIFKEHGPLKDVRLVTYRSGAPKGLAYVEYETAEAAAQAVLKLDGLKIGDHTMSVAISNPPPRKLPFGQMVAHVPTLGSGKKETNIRGKARTQVALVPRTVQRPGAGLPTNPSGSGDDTPASSGDSTQPQSNMSNADFRKMLLK